MDKKCKYCATWIPSDAKICPHCRKTQGWTPAAKWFLGIILFLAIMSAITGNRENKTVIRSDNPSDFDAYFMSQSFVKKILKAPATADFASSSESQVERSGDNRFMVYSYVDAQNSFGAKLRNYYTCELQYVGDDKWKLIDVKLNSP